MTGVQTCALPISDHDDRKAKKKQLVGPAFEFFKFGLLDCLLLRKMSPDRIHQGFRILLVFGRITADLVAQDRVSFNGGYGVDDIKLEGMA